MLTGPTRVALVQAGILPVLAVAGFVLGSKAATLGLVYGSLVALAASLSMVWREQRAIRHPEWDGRKLLGVFIVTALERLLIVTLMLGVGFAALKLSPLFVLLGLTLSQSAWLTVVFSAENKNNPA